MTQMLAELVEDGMMTVPEVQEFSRLSRSFLYGRMEDGTLIYSKAGSAADSPPRVARHVGAGACVA